MPFLDGIPCSIHGIVLPDGVAVLRPVEMVTLRRGHEFVYAGCATYWDPDRRSSASRCAPSPGARASSSPDEVDFRGTFTVDGVVAADGFWPTELNPRFGAGHQRPSPAASGLPIVLVNDLIVGGHDIGRTPLDFEADLVDARPTPTEAAAPGMGGLDIETELESDDGRSTTMVRGRGPSRAGRRSTVALTTGAGFVRCIYDHASTPIGPSTARSAAAFWDFAADEFGTDTAGLSAGTGLLIRR